MKKRTIKKDKKNSFIRGIISMMLIILLGCVSKTMVSAAENGQLIANPSGLSVLTDGNVSYSQKMERTYALRVSTGVADGSYVGFFGIEYKDTQGKVHVQYIFPHDGDYSRGFKQITSDSPLDQSRRELVTQFGYTFKEWSDLDAKGIMEVASEDIFFFQTKGHDIASVEKIYVYTDITSSASSSWTCTGLKVYEINELAGRKMYGYVSPEQYLSMAGRQLAALVGDSATFTTSIDKIHVISPTANDYKLDTNIVAYQDKEADIDSEYIFKIDIADVYGAGIESFVNYEGTKIRSVQLPETLNLEITYECVDGRSEIVNIPVITGAYTNAMANVSLETKLVDFAGQGESLAVPANLPYFKKLSSVRLTYGPQAALEASGMVEISASEMRQNFKNKIVSNSDTISITGISMYKAGAGNSVLTYEVQDNTIVVPKITGTPLYYYTADTYRGVEIGLENTMRFALQLYQEGVRLEPTDNQTKYLVVIETDSAANSINRQIIPNIKMKLSYTNTSGASVQTEAYDLKELAKEYYGYTPNQSGEDCSYAMNVSNGQRLFVLISLSGVEKFTAATFSLKNSFEEWQLSNFAIYRADEISDRHAQWIDGGREFFGQNAAFAYRRQVNGIKEEIPKSAEVYNAAVQLFVQADKEEQTLDFSSLSVTEVEKIFDWMAVDPYSLEFAKADADYLGFYDTYNNYQVDVKVADNSTNTLDDGDSGSKNHFYFQLVFEKGSSAVVQANQLLTSDGFLTGQTATFNIATNYDYGELVSVRVIPDDFTTNADPYDKLNIEYINVTKHAKSGYSTVWNVANVGWIGIDYVDEGRAVSATAETGRTMEELGHNYAVTGSSAGVKLQFAITTGNLPEEAEGRQFVGSVMAEVGYFDANGGYRTANFDVVQSMYNYANKTPTGNANNGNRESDSSFMFLENRTNRFTHFISNVSELVDIRLYVYGNTAGALNIDSISAALVVSEGPLAINKWGEYERGSTLFPLTKNENPINVFKTTMGGVASSQISFKSTDKGLLTGLLSGTWPYDIKQETTIGQEYLNINVYPETRLVAVPDLGMQVVMDYADSFGRTYRIKQPISLKTSSSGVFYYGADGIRVGDIGAIKEVRVEKVSGSGDMEVGEVIVQKILEGQIRETNVYDLAGVKASAAPMGNTTMILTDTGERQKVRLSFADNMPGVSLEPGIRDVAVAIRYTSSFDPDGEVYTSPYVYLSESKKDRVAGGMIGEFTFDIQNIAEIKGISVAATGGLAIETKNAVVEAYQTLEGNMKLNGWYSVCESGQIENESRDFEITTDRTNALETLIPIHMELTTGALREQNTGTNAAIRAKIQYIGFDNVRYTVEIPDLRKYTVSGTYNTSEPAKIQLLLPNIKEIVFVTFEPYDEFADVTEFWKLGNIALSYGLESDLKSVNIVLGDDSGLAYEGVPARVAIRKLLVTLQYHVGLLASDLTDEQKAEQIKSVQNTTEGLLLHTGEELYVKASVQNSAMGSKISVYEVVGEARRDVTATYLSAVLENGEQRFMVPATAISEDTTFEIVAASAELTEFEAVLLVTVKKPEQAPGNTESTPQPTPETGTESTPQPAPEAGTESTPQPAPEAGTESTQEPAPEAGTESTPQPAPEAGTESTQEPAPEAGTETTPQA